MPSYSLRAAPNLSETFDIIRPAFSEALLSGEIELRLRALAARLRLTTAVGFECRLAADSPQVDLQQGIPVSGGPAELKAICESMLASMPVNSHASAIWQRIHDFSLQWGNPQSGFHQRILHIWLEFDLPEAPEAELIPSVFASLAPSPEVTQSTVLEEFVEFLSQAELNPALKATIARCRAACPTGAHISHVGLMLGRPVRGCRIDIGNLALDAFEPYLEQIHWPGDRAAAQAQVEELLQFVDTVVLCVMVADQVHPQLGLEAYFNNPDDPNLPWEPLLNYLVEKDLCTPSKRDGLFEWAGMTTPQNAPAPWPESLIVEGLLKPVDTFGVFRRRLNHIKLSLAAHHAPQAKAYFGYAHEWRQSDAG